MTASSLELKAPAKLNLFLHVVGQRSDGMHLLESVFVLIDLCDDIVLELDPSGEITRTGDVVGDVEKDLCVRAARALQQASGTTLGCRILVKKRIPAGAGMGGGSSDCASTLMGLNKLWGLNWPRKKLMPIGESLGADVPFFLFGQNAFAQGTGGILRPMAVPSAWAAIVMPVSAHRYSVDFSASSLDKRHEILENFVSFSATQQSMARADRPKRFATRCCTDQS